MSMNAYMAIRLVSLNSGEAERKEHMYVWEQKLEFVGVRKFSFVLQIRSPQFTPSLRIIIIIYFLSNMCRLFVFYSDCGASLSVN